MTLQTLKTLILSVLVTLAAAVPFAAQDAFKVGERVTYSVTFDKFRDVAYAETHVVSRGTLSGRDAVELRSRLRTLSLINAAFYAVDEARSSFVDPATGLPLHFTRTADPDGIPKRSSTDLLQNPQAGVDLLALIFRIRQSGGTGTATLLDGDRTFAVEFQISGAERVTVPAGEFDTTVVTVKSEYFTELGFPDVVLNLTADADRVPVVVQLNRSKKSGFRAEAASIQNLAPELPVQLTPSVTPTPRPAVSPAPTPTPAPYVNDQPLAPELAFELGEALEYRVSAAGRSVGSFVLRARERREIEGRDTLILTATVTNAAPGNPVFALNDTAVVHADPITLAPYQIDLKFGGALAGINQKAVFDPLTGAVNFGSGRVEAPIATHSLLSLVYAMRSFNLKPSQIRDNPVNDTRVAVFWESRPYVFTLRPSAVLPLDTGGGIMRPAQLVTINTGNPQLDSLALKVWLSADGNRVPLRFSAGIYQADLVSETTVSPN